MFSNILKMLGVEAVVETSPENYMSAMNQVGSALGSNYVLHGSGACLLHGAQFDQSTFPKDIDISVDNLVEATAALEKAAKKGSFTIQKRPDSTDAVSHFMITLKNGAKVELELTSAEDFGLKKTSKININGITVTSVPETLLSLHLRENYKGLRDKDKVAFKFLVEKHKAYFQSEEGESELTELAIKTRNTALINKVNAILNQTSENKKTEFKSSAADKIPASFLDPKYKSSPISSRLRESSAAAEPESTPPPAQNLKNK